MVFFKFPEKSLFSMCNPEKLGQTKAEIIISGGFYEKNDSNFRCSDPLFGLRSLRLPQ